MTKNKPFHVQYLNNEYAHRFENNPRYSLRSFARDLSVTPSWLSDFLSEKKGLSPSSAERIAPILGLSATEERLFLLSAKAYHSRSIRTRKEAQKELSSLKKSESFKMRPNDFIATGTWYHQAILELTELEDFKHHETDIVDRLRLPLMAVKRALKDLQNAGLLEIKDGKMRSCFPETESSTDFPSAAIRRYHELIIQKSIKALHEQPVLEREYISVTLAFDASRATEAKKALRKFQKEFANEFYMNSNSKDSVYQLSLQFFRLDTKRK